MPKDDALRQLLKDFAESSNGRLAFRVTTSTQLAKDLDLRLARSTNSIYVFTLTDSNSEQQTCVAFTLTLDGDRRPATRAEALGRSLADSDGLLFNFNPFLLVFDYTGERLLAVSAAELFDAFARHVSGKALSYSGSASFSLSPNFRHGTIHMYAEVREPTVWATSTSAASLSTEDLIDFLGRVAQETRDKSADIPEIVRAIRARLDAEPAESATETDAGPGRALAAADPGYAQLEPTDEAVRVDERLWQIILAAIASSAGVLLVGPPGTGKSALIRKAIGTISEKRRTEGLAGLKPPLWATPDESWTSRELIGGETVADGEIVFRPGWVLRAIAENRWLVLDEANRGDLDRIFGALLTWLAGGDVAVGVESATKEAKLVELGWTSGASRIEIIEAVADDQPGKIRYLASRDEWRLLGTYNALDAQRVFRIGAALGRRFVRIPIPPISPDDFNQILKDRVEDLGTHLLTKIGLLYKAHYEAEVTRVGPALFLGMCSYLRSAVTMRRPSPMELEREGRPMVGTTAGQPYDADVRSEVTTPAASARSAVADETSRPAAPASGESEETTPGAGSDSPLGASGAGTVRTTSDFADLILSEAYVLNLGTFLAQLEEPDLAQLTHRIRTSAALTQKGVEWVTEMTQALA